MSHPPGPSGQPYVPTEAEQAEHLRNLKSRLKEFWVEQLQEVRCGGWSVCLSAALFVAD